MPSLWFFFLSKRQFTWLLMAALIAVGTYAAVIIPKESNPEVIVPIGIVRTTYPGASALDVERLITNKIEDSVGSIENLDKLTSSSNDSISIITVQFNASANVDKSMQDLKDLVDRVKPELPEEANDPDVTRVDFSNQPVFVVSVSADLPPTEFSRLSKEVESELEDIAGVSGVDVAGVRDREVQVVVNPDALHAFNLTLQDVSRAIRASNVALPAGTITTNRIEYAIQFEGDITDPEVVRDIVIKNVQGQPVFVHDVATVSNGVTKPTTYSRVSVNGGDTEPAMTFSVHKAAGADVTALTTNVQNRITALTKPGALLEGSQVLVSFDAGKEVRKNLGELVGAGLETVVLVIICLLLTIGWRESLVAAVSIPLSFVIAFIGLLVSGNTINFVSLFALILAVGILVDSGIVVTEAIHTRMRSLGDPDEAARAAIREYAWPLIGGTMTTVAVFVPLFFISGITGEFISSIPFTIIFVLIASIVVALGMVPLIAIKATKSTSSNKFEEIQEAYTHRAQTWYKTKLLTFFANKRAQRIFLWALGLGLIVSLALPFTGLVKAVFFPGEDADFVYVELETRQGTPLTETDLTLRSIEEKLYEKDYIESFTTTSGAGSMFSDSPSAGAKFANVTVALKTDRTLTSADVATDLRASLTDIPNAQIRVTEQQGGPPSGAPVLIQFFGDDLEELRRVTEQSEQILASISGTTNVTASTKNVSTEFALTIDNAKASVIGLSPATVADTLRTAVFGTTATTIRRQGDDIDVIVKLALNPEYSDPSLTTDVSLDAIRNLTIETPQGSVLLGSVLKEELRAANASIAHKDKSRVESVSAYNLPDTTSGDIVAEFKKRESELKLQDGVTIKYGGETEDINKSFTEMFLALVAGLVFMLAILVLSFNSLRYALYLLMVVPLSLIGVLDGLAITGKPISFTSLLGVVALAGVIINHAIILMDSMIHYRHKGGDRSLEEVVADAAVSRLRPIVLTTITTVIAMIPLARISDFWSPLAYAIMFGLSFAMILTLILVPTLYYRHEKKLLERQKGKIDMHPMVKPYTTPIVFQLPDIH
jgi:multidrug efflux pump